MGRTKSGLFARSRTARALRIPRFVVESGALALVVVACSSSGASNSGGGDAGAGDDAGAVPANIPVPAEAQRSGDPQAGYLALVEKGYVGCGIPYSAYHQVFGDAPPELRLPGRTGDNANASYDVTVYTTESGVEVVSPNCLSCHAAQLGGKLVIGLGNAARDFTSDPSKSAGAASLLVQDPKEQAELAKFVDRLKTVGPYTTESTVGANPGDSLAAILFAHRDRTTLAWSDTPLLDVPPKIAVPVDVPPWWRMAKKNAMFYTGAGRGDHARIMMTASTLCTDTVDLAKAIDAYFNDVQAYITSLTPPKYPYAIDAARAAAGKTVFDATCSRCHGTYGDGATYPNVLVPVESVGTDAMLATGTGQFAAPYVKWFNESFYGQTARLEPSAAYYAPPLDGIWATSPYLHNGSVPSLATLLDSTTRPAYFTRSTKADDFDESEVGVRYARSSAGKSAAAGATAKAQLVDTTLLGYGNQGHTYGDALSPDDRAAVIEYLKTL